MSVCARKLWQEVALIGCVAASVMGMGANARAADVAIVSNVKVMSDKNPDDMSSLETWKKSYIKEGMSDQEKAIAVWKTVTKYRHQTNPPNEGIESMGNVHDPMKTFNVYGYGMCCCAASDVEGLARYAGLPARGRIINLHSVPEVWYSNSWHLFDSSLMFYVTKPDGLVASVDEMKANIADWKKDHPEIKHDSDWKTFAKNEGWKKGPALFANCPFYDKDGGNRAGVHGWFSNMQEYNYDVGGKGRKIVVPPDTNGEVNVFDYGATLGYQVNVELREGEKLTRNWQKGDMRAFGVQRDMGDLAPGRTSSGMLEYDALADSKLAGDALACENLKIEGGKIRIADAAKPGTLIVRMPCSYMYLDGSMSSLPVVGEGASVKASISVNNGLDWTELARFDKSGVQKTDLKGIVSQKYDYRVKLELSGAGTGLDGLRLANGVKHSQAPLPIIVEGDNKLTFSAAEIAEGTVTVQGNMNETTGGNPAKPLTVADFHPVLNGVTMKRFAVGTTAESDDKAGDMDDIGKAIVNPPTHGSAIVPVITPGDITRVRMGTHWRARNAIDGFAVSVSFDHGKTWKEFTKLGLANPAKSEYFVCSDVPAGAREVQVKFDGTQTNAAELFDLRLDVDYKEPAGGFRPVKVTYTWDEAGAAKTDEHVCAKPGDTWTIHCGPGTVAKSYSVELAK